MKTLKCDLCEATAEGETFEQLMQNLQPHYMSAHPEVMNDPSKIYDKVIEIDLNTLEPHLVGPHTPDLGRAVSDLRAEVTKEGYPAQVR